MTAANAANGPQATPATGHPGELRLEVKLTALARHPSRGELQAITAAVALALGTRPGPMTPETGPWRFSGRWWDPRGQGRAWRPPS
jgi:hypothetical protein